MLLWHIRDIIPPADLGIWIGLLFRVSGGFRVSRMKGEPAHLSFGGQLGTVPINGYESLHGVEGTFGCVQGR